MYVYRKGTGQYSAGTSFSAPLGGISSSVLSVFFTDKFALSQSDARISVAYNSCQWKTLTKRLMKCPPEHYGKAHGSLLSGWMNYNYTACCWFPTSSNILILPSQCWQIRFESCWLLCSKCRILVLLQYIFNIGKFWKECTGWMVFSF